MSELMKAQYCGRECQKQHWSQHKVACQSPLTKKTWQPRWVAENRQPAFIGGSLNTQIPFGGKKYFWGNVPAFDLLNLPKNEGSTYDQDLRLLFAASGDLRNVVKTVASIPLKFSNSVSLYINDIDFDIVARNIILLLVAVMVPNRSQAVKCMLHLWYSALVRESDAEILATYIRPLIEEVNVKIAAKASGTVLGKTWTIGRHSIRVELTKEAWKSMLSYLEAPRGVNQQQAHQIRTAVTMAASRVDYRERRMIAQMPEYRVSADMFRENGILLPFGHSRRDFIIPNPTFFQAAEWPMKDSADPLDGWNLHDVLQTASGPASNDLYGKLYHYLTKLFSSFLRRLSSGDYNFHLLNADARELPKRLKGEEFARIEVANISDGAYLGIEQTVAYLGPLLQSPSTNAHATLVTLFMNATHEIAELEPHRNSLPSEMQRASRYMPFNSRPSSPYDPRMMMLMSALPLVRDMDELFDKYMRGHDFKA